MDEVEALAVLRSGSSDDSGGYISWNNELNRPNVAEGEVSLSGPFSPRELEALVVLTRGALGQNAAAAPEVTDEMLDVGAALMDTLSYNQDLPFTKYDFLRNLFLEMHRISAKLPGPV